jgi:hypothetical protein
VVEPGIENKTVIEEETGQEMTYWNSLQIIRTVGILPGTHYKLPGQWVLYLELDYKLPTARTAGTVPGTGL